MNRNHIHFWSLIGFTLITALSGFAAPVTLPSDLVDDGAGADPDTGLPKQVHSKVTGHVMCFVSAGDFTMGRDDGDPDEKPAHQVTKWAYYLGKYPVSNAQYEVYKSDHTRGKYSAGNQDPVTQVSWDDATGYINWVGVQEGKAGLYAMPTEAAWEKASQGGLNAPVYPWGDTITSSQKIYSDKAAVAVTGGSPNGLGFHHMTGNVFCWCYDWYDEKYYQSSSSTNPEGPASGKLRALRGGTWYIYEKSHRCADRWKAFPETKSDIIGIRIGRVLTDVFP